MTTKNSGKLARAITHVAFEDLGSFGLSIRYMNKGPIHINRSIKSVEKHKAVVVRDVKNSDLLEYSADAIQEGIGAIVSVPINFSDRVIGVLRLYHHDQWDISARDLDSLFVLAEIIGLAMMYARMNNAILDVKNIVGDVHDAWLE